MEIDKEYETLKLSLWKKINMSII
ncbi:hypothetical protein [Lachnoanaerobaculum saburreum]